MKKTLILLILSIFLLYSNVSLGANETNNTEPEIYSKVGVIYNRDSKEVIWGKNEILKVPMASTTKIMSAIIVLENANLSDIVTVSKKAGRINGSSMGLKSKDKVTVEDLLYGLMLPSGNDAAIALAEHVSGSIEEFCKLMNEKGKELGLKNTNFCSPHGLDSDEHYTTRLWACSNYRLCIKYRKV